MRAQEGTAQLLQLLPALAHTPVAEDGLSQGATGRAAGLLWGGSGPRSRRPASPSRAKSGLITTNPRMLSGRKSMGPRSRRARTSPAKSSDHVYQFGPLAQYVSSDADVQASPTRSPTQYLADAPAPPASGFRGGQADGHRL